MKTSDTIFLVIDLILLGVAIIFLVKASYSRKFWSYWERFNRSKEVLPIPTIQFSPEKKARGKKYLKVSVLSFVVLIILIFVQVWTSK